MARELFDRQRFKKNKNNCNSKANFIASANRNMDNVYTFWEGHIYLINK